MEQQRLVEDRLWELIEPLLPEPPPARGPGGRPRIDDRAALEGILFVLSTGVPMARPTTAAGLRLGAHGIAAPARLAGRRRSGLVQGVHRRGVGAREKGAN